MFYCHIILCRENVTLFEKFSHSLTFETLIVWKILAFQCYWWKHQNARNTVEFPKLSINMKNFTRRKHRSALRKLFCPPPDKSFLRTYTGMLSQWFENAVLWLLEMVQCKFFFLTTTRNMLLENVCWKICKVSGFFAVLRKYIFYNVKTVEVRKISEVFWAKRYCRMSDIFC